MPRDTLRFQTNIPELVALAFDGGLKVEGRYGDQVMFTLQDDRVMYVPPIVEEHIRKLGIRKGEEFRVTKRETKEGNRRSIQWAVERAPEPASPAPVKARGEAVQEAAVVPTPATAQSTTNGNGKPPAPPASVPVAGQPSELPHTPLPYTATGAGQFLLSALVNTIDICEAAQKYANTKGFAIQFASEDVRALAITAFIQHSRENGGGR